MGLVVVRKTNEAVMIGGNITVRVIKVEKNREGQGRVRLLIDAPRDVVVLREELVREPNREA